MRKTVALLLVLAAVFSLVGCKTEYSLTRKQAESLIDTSYYENIAWENRNASGANALTPFSRLDAESFGDSPAPVILNHFYSLAKFKWSKPGNPVFVNGRRFTTGKTLTFTVYIETEDEEFSVCPTLVFINHDIKNGVDIYNDTIRLNPESLTVPYFTDTDEDAEFGDGYFAYGVSISSKKKAEPENSDLPVKLFSIQMSFKEVGHYTVKVIDSYKNDSKYTDTLSVEVR